MHNTAVCLPVFTTVQKNRETVGFHQVQGTQLLGALPRDSQDIVNLTIKFPNIVANICGTSFTLEDNTYRYLILSHHGITMPFNVIALDWGFAPPKVVIRLFEGLNLISHPKPN